MGDDLAGMRVQTRYATTDAVIENIGASLTRGSLRVPVQIKAKQPFEVVLETSTGAEAVRGSAEVIGHAGDATWIRFLSAADNQGDDARWILADVKVVLQGDLRDAADKKIPTEQFEAITAVNSEQEALDAIRAGNAEPVPLAPLAPLMQVPVMMPRAPILPANPAMRALKTKLDRRFDLSTGEAVPLNVAALAKSSGLAPKVELAAVIVDAIAPKLEVADEAPKLAAGSGLVPRVERATTNSDDLAIPVEPIATAPTVAAAAADVIEQASTQPLGLVVAAPPARVRPPTAPQQTEPRAERTTSPPPVADTPTAHAETQPLPMLAQICIVAPAEPPAEASRVDTRTTETPPLVERAPEDPDVPLSGAPRAVVTEDAEPMVMEPESSMRPTEQQEPLRLEIKSDEMKPLAAPAPVAPAPIPRTPVSVITVGLDLDPTKPTEVPAEALEAKRPHVTDQIARERGIRPITSRPRRAPLQPRQILIGAAGIAGACMIATISTIIWARGAVGDARADAARARASAAAPVSPTVPMIATTTAETVVEPTVAAPAATLDHVECALSVSANVRGSTVYVDGTPHGPAPAEISAACDVPVLVEVRHARYEDFTSTVTPSGGKLEIAAALEREEAAVSVRSDPPAQVVYKGKVLGTTPLVAKLPRYEQSTLHFRARGMAEDWRRIVPKTATKTVSVTLKKR